MAASAQSCSDRVTTVPQYSQRPDSRTDSGAPQLGQDTLRMPPPSSVRTEALRVSFQS